MPHLFKVPHCCRAPHHCKVPCHCKAPRHAVKLRYIIKLHHTIKLHYIVKLHHAVQKPMLFQGNKPLQSAVLHLFTFMSLCLCAFAALPLYILAHLYLCAIAALHCINLQPIRSHINIIFMCTLTGCTYTHWNYTNLSSKLYLIFEIFPLTQSFVLYISQSCSGDPLCGSPPPPTFVSLLAPLLTYSTFNKVRSFYKS